MTRASATKLIVLAAIGGAFVLTLALMARSTPPASAASCAHANTLPSDGSNGDFRQALTCLINKERTSRDKKALDPNAKLRKVAGAHTEVMLNRDCFDHVCGGESSLTKRLKRAGYLQGASWAYAENIGYESSPREMFDRWMASRANRRKMLSDELVDLGVGVGHGTPNPDRPDDAFVTYTAIFGHG
jgi:uncharacterized protein YkwD